MWHHLSWNCVMFMASCFCWYTYIYIYHIIIYIIYILLRVWPEAASTFISMWCFSWGANSTAAEAFCLISILPSLVLSWKPRCFFCWCFLLKNIEIWLTNRSLLGFWSNFPVNVARVEWLIRHENAKLGQIVVSNIFYVYPCLGKLSNLTNIFQRGWNHQLARGFSWTSYEFQHVLILLNSIGWGVEAHHWRAWRDVRESRFCKHGGWLFVKFSNVLWLMSGVWGKCCFFCFGYVLSLNFMFICITSK